MPFSSLILISLYTVKKLIKIFLISEITKQWIKIQEIEKKREKKVSCEMHAIKKVMKYSNWNCQSASLFSSTDKDEKRLVDECVSVSVNECRGNRSDRIEWQMRSTVLNLSHRSYSEMNLFAYPFRTFGFSDARNFSN